MTAESKTILDPPDGRTGKSHPNYERWERARRLSEERGKLVEAILSEEIKCEGLRVLDIGAGEGGTAKVFSYKNFVVTVEKNPGRISNQTISDSLFRILGDANSLPFKKNVFDVIILQDVIEHFAVTKNFFDDLYPLIKNDGIIYLSTPNKFSVFNLFSDPHWGLPFVSLMKRKNIKKYFLKYYRNKDYYRQDIAELFSLKEIERISGHRFDVLLRTRKAAELLLNGHKGLIWSDFHLWLLTMIRVFKLNKIIMKIVNDKPGIINKFFTPTFYLILTSRT